MSDSARPIPADLSSENPAMRRRRFAELRLKFYGLLAIAVAATALVALLWSVVQQAAGAVTETYVTLPITLSQDEIDPDLTGDPDVIRKANFAGLTRDLMRAQFPSVRGRTERRALNDILSVGASFELADHVKDNPELIGHETDFRFLASDITDLYLKGFYGELTDQPVTGRLTLTLDGKDATVSSTEGDFSSILALVKDQLLIDAQLIRDRAALQDNGARVFTERAATEADPEERDKLIKQAEARAKARDDLIAEAEALELRSRSATGVETLTNANPSVLIKVAGGWIKLDDVDGTGGSGTVLLPPDTDIENAGDWELFVTVRPERGRKVSDAQMVWIETLKDRGAVEVVFNWRFFTAGDSRDPELAGIWGAAVGSFWTMLVTFCLAFPIGVLSAIYLEEFAPKNRITDFIEVNINNLAAVPSIVFGLLGLSVFLGVFGVPRSAPLAGGIVLALMTLPTIIIAARASIRAVPPSIRDAALGVGASKLQASFHHVLPLAMPGILTGTIIGMAQALGETAPLIMIGMVAFIVDIPTGITDSATVLPVQVYRWSDFPERAFEARTAAAICVLLVFLVLMNALAIFLRRRFERRW